MSSTSIHNGTIFADRYRIMRRIAVGGMGAVYEVTHIETDRRRALKVMHAHCVQDDELRQRFRLEARVAAAIETEHVVDVFDAGIDPATKMPFIVMELLRGEDLRKLLQKCTKCTAIETVTYLRQVAGALDKMHQAGLVHRDLKPDNLFLSHREDGAPWVKILDFGIAKVLAEGAGRTNVTTGIGTPLYMAPEQFRTDLAISCATDLFALGMVAYTLLVGFPYWREESRRSEGNVYRFAREIMEGPTESATARARRAGVELPGAFDAWFARATAFSPSCRFQAAGDMIMALALALGVSPAGLDSMETAKTQVRLPLAEGLVPTSRTAPGVTSTKPPISRSGRRLPLVVAALGVAVLSATGAVLRGRAPANTAQNGALLRRAVALQAATSAPALPTPAAPPAGEAAPVEAFAPSADRPDVGDIGAGLPAAPPRTPRGSLAGASPDPPMPTRSRWRRTDAPSPVPEAGAHDPKTSGEYPVVSDPYPIEPDPKEPGSYVPAVDAGPARQSDTKPMPWEPPQQDVPEF